MPRYRIVFQRTRHVEVVQAAPTLEQAKDLAREQMEPDGWIWAYVEEIQEQQHAD